LITKQLVIREGQKDRREAIQFGTPASATPATPAPAVTTVTPTRTTTLSSDTGGGGTNTQKVVGFAAIGLGVVGVAVGTIFGLSSMSKHNDAKAACPAACPDPAGVALWDDARAAGNVSTVGFIFGGLGLAGGTVLLLTAKPSETSVQVGLGPSSLRLEGAW
jgi:hypothetical protein